jgi:membrane-associated protease RseP (regulator of RpoE activity)
MPRFEILLCLFAIIAAPIGLVIHELGHFLAARVLMLEVVSFQAGPFLMDWKDGERTFRFRPLSWLSAGGVRTKVSAETPTTKRLLLTAAGPAASFLFSGIYWLAPVTDMAVIDETDFLQWLLLLIAANSFVVFLLTALPLRAPPWNTKGMPTDGYKILALIRSMNRQ